MDGVIGAENIPLTDLLLLHATYVEAKVQVLDGDNKEADTSSLGGDGSSIAGAGGSLRPLPPPPAAAFVVDVFNTSVDSSARSVSTDGGAVETHAVHAGLAPAAIPRGHRVGWWYLVRLQLSQYGLAKKPKVYTERRALVDSIVTWAMNGGELVRLLPSH